MGGYVRSTPSVDALQVVNADVGPEGQPGRGRRASHFATLSRAVTGPRADESESTRTHEVKGYTSEKSWEASHVDGLVSEGGSVGSAWVHNQSSSCWRRGPYLSEGGHGA